MEWDLLYLTNHACPGRVNQIRLLQVGPGPLFVFPTRYLSESVSKSLSFSRKVGHYSDLLLLLGVL